MFIFLFIGHNQSRGKAIIQEQELSIKQGLTYIAQLKKEWIKKYGFGTPGFQVHQIGKSQNSSCNFSIESKSTILKVEDGLYDTIDLASEDLLHSKSDQVCPEGLMYPGHSSFKPKKVIIKNQDNYDFFNKVNLENIKFTLEDNKEGKTLRIFQVNGNLNTKMTIDLTNKKVKEFKTSFYDVRSDIKRTIIFDYIEFKKINIGQFDKNGIEVIDDKKERIEREKDKEIVISLEDGLNH